ncbi:hypothetical protein FRC03_011465 [Tulasnella sp. 419]|nr:hypothetical protein FRC03_011465 [Tulasnella sp. 419]
MEGPIITIESPDACTSLAFSSNKDNFVVAGFQDGTVRSYILPNQRVYRAIRPLGTEVSSLKFDPRKASDTSSTSKQNVWIACGKRILLFDIDGDRLVMDRKDVSEVVSPVMAIDDDNVLNQIAVSNSRITYTCDSGEVGVYDLILKTSDLMKTSHSNIANCAVFVPSRPSEVVTGGFDQKVLHYDTIQKSVLSTFEFGTAPSSCGTTSLSPPFVLSLSISPSGCIAASTADGRIWIGREGSKLFRSEGKKKRRKWEGLRHTDPTLAREFVIASGPIVAVEFITEFVIAALTLSGSVKIMRLAPSFSLQACEESISTIWEGSTHDIRKTNALALGPRSNVEGIMKNAEYWLAVGGVGDRGQGYIEIWTIPARFFQSLEVHPST